MVLTSAWLHAACMHLEMYFAYSYQLHVVMTQPKFSWLLYWSYVLRKVRSVAGLVMQGSGSLVEVDSIEMSWVSITWCWHFPHPHGTGAVDGEWIRPETDTGNGWEAINWVSTWWRIMVRESGVWISVRPKVTLSQTSRLFLVQSVTAPVRNINSLDIKRRPLKSYYARCSQLSFGYRHFVFYYTENNPSCFDIT